LGKSETGREGRVKRGGKGVTYQKEEFHCRKTLRIRGPRRLGRTEKVKAFKEALLLGQKKFEVNG